LRGRVREYKTTTPEKPLRDLEEEGNKPPLNFWRKKGG
jgi:hypothetical protein